MDQHLELAPPETQTESEIPRTAETVEAASLLKPEERKAARRRGWLFGVECGGLTYLVPAHRQVPADATVPRTAGGSLVGVAAVTGG